MSFKLAETTQTSWLYEGGGWGSSFKLTVAKDEQSFLALVLDPDYRYTVTAIPENSKDPMASVNTYICKTRVEEADPCSGRGPLGPINVFTVCTGSNCTQSFNSSGYQELKVSFANNNGFFQGKLKLIIWISRVLAVATTMPPTTKPTSTILPSATPTNTIPSQPTPYPTSTSVPVTQPASALPIWAWGVIAAGGLIIIGGGVAIFMYVRRQRTSYSKVTEKSALLDSTPTE